MTSTRTWLDRYAALVEHMYAIRKACPSLVALGASTLAPRHPLPPDQLALLADPDGAGKGLTAPIGALEILARWLQAVAFALRDTARLIRLQWRAGAAVRRRTASGATVLLKTWAFGPQSVRTEGDFYYATLVQQLQRRGVKAMLLCGDARSAIDPAFARTVLDHPSGAAVPEQALIPWWAPVVVAGRQLSTAWALRRFARTHAGAPVATVAATAARGCLEPIAMRNVLQFYVAREAMRRCRAQVYVTFHEGQPWELPAWHGARAANPACVVVGYQHTILMPYSFALLRPHRGSWEHASPDVILTVGDQTRRMIADGTGQSARLATFGSYRRQPGSDATQPPQPARRTVLVLPEGNLPESCVLFNFAMDAAAALPDHRFIFRCHPLLPFNRVRPHLARDPDALRNVELSPHPSIATDFDRSSIVLYRGSSAVLYGVLRGLKPVYVHHPAHPEIDPLFEITRWRERVDAVERFADVLRGFSSTTVQAAAAEWQPVAEYIDRYTVPVDDEAIDRFLSVVGLRSEEAVACAA